MVSLSGIHTYKIKELEMNQLDETYIMSHFYVTKQDVIANEIFKDYNTSHPVGVKAALNNAAWRGFIAGLDAAKTYYEANKT